MKVLAIRGANLASLAGEFAVEFHVPPLADAGLFAISGPTGAGKSTLLDALCLALYDDTPRLQHATAKGVALRDVGEDTLTPQDPRNLLRRGCAHGYAEVDFVAGDGRPYRARWSVRRARNKSRGRLQASEMSLLRLDDQQAVGKVKREIKEAIEARLGLNLAQFTRAVLLAQNEFGAFLKADDNDRAALLETLTGSEHYSTLSQRAYQRHKEEQQALERLQQRLDDQAPLTEEQRQALEAQLQEQQTSHQTLLDERREAEAQQRWFQQLEQLQQGCQQATEALERASSALAAAEPQRHYLEQVQQAQEARPLADERRRCRQVLERAEAARLGAVRDQHRAAVQQQEQQQRQQQAEALERQAQQAWEQAQPLLQESLALEQQIAALAPGLADAERDHSAREREREQAAKALRQCQADQQRLVDRQTETTLWLEIHQSWAALGEHWPRWEALLQQAHRLHDDDRETTYSLREIDASLQGLKTRRTTLDQELLRASEQRDQAQQSYQSAEQATHHLDPETLATQRRDAEQRRDGIREARRRWQELESLTTEARQLEQEQQQNLQQHSATTEQRDTTRQALAIAESSLAQGRKTLERVRAACGEGAESLRATLEAEQPCPVCGAIEHPYAGPHPALNALLRDQEREVDALQQRRDQLSGEAATLEERLRQQEQATDAYEQRRAKLETRLDTVRDAWLTHPCHLDSPNPDGELAAAEAESIGRLEQLNQQEAEQRRYIRERDQARRTLEQARSEEQTLKDESGRLDTEQQRLNERRTHTQQRSEQIRQRLAQHLDELDNAFTDASWRQVWQRDPLATSETFRQQAEQWSNNQRQARELEQTLHRATLQTEHARQALAETAQRQNEALALLAARREQLDNRRSELRERLGHLGGDNSAACQQALQQALDHARHDHQSARQQHQQARQTLAVSEQTLLHREQEYTQAQRQLDDATSTLARWLEGYNAHRPEKLDESTLTTLLQHDSRWRQEQADGVRQRQRALEQAQTVLSERSGQLERHQAAGRPEGVESAAQLDAILEELATRLQAQEEKVGELRSQRRQDDERLQRGAALREELESQGLRTRTWGQLNELIGSADGKKFRNFAQQLTLDLLLGYANRHLLDLSRRYRLERVDDTLALQVVDQDMGDEIRSVHSLSGGESFLISLALALGLASLSSNRIKVESLFIDEGFGSLDAETLRVAMDALDRLQAHGRKVGVISHVQEMSERIAVQIKVQPVGAGRSRIIVE